ncbi:MAG TPA: BNR-4 repeat-containing protein [Opitutaceae bacterium]|nr:BNR-4 repeat-containing protein [Opitutaceae bacterium]
MIKKSCPSFALLAFAAAASFAADAKAPKAPAKPDDLQARVGDGYRGIWYMNQPTKDEHRYKYSGGFATYPQQHVPIAVHVASQRKTFFVFGGSAGNVSVQGDELQHLVSYYDHATGTVPRPVRLLTKRTEDAHDNPTLSIDAAGYLYVFSSAHGTTRPSYIHRSRRPYDIAQWELLQTSNFSYTQPWYLPQSRRFLFLHTLYKNGQRTLNWKTSTDGREWAEPQLLAHMEMGSYQVSTREGDTDRVVTAFDLHPDHGRGGTGLNFRTNIYFLETRDAGRSWTTVDGARVTLPFTKADNPALVHDYRAENRNVYLKDIAFTAQGQPVILYLTSKGFSPGPESGPYQWHTARWTGRTWEFRPFTTSDHNYDHGSLYIEADGTWRVIAPTAPGPQPFGTGGEMLAWVSRDEGKTWAIAHTLTHDSRYNHAYARKPVNAHPDFYALWADGSPLEPTPSSLYFATKDGKVYRLPTQMSGETAKPELVQ